MHVKVKLTERSFPFAAVDAMLDKLSGKLVGRWAGVVRALQEWLKTAPVALKQTQFEELESLCNRLLQQVTWGIVDDSTNAVFAYGALVARLGEIALTEPPTEEQVNEILGQPGFVARQALSFAKAYTLNEVKSKDADTLSVFRTHLLSTLEAGDNPLKAASTLAKEIDGDFAGWRRIARTETARALNMGLFDESARLGIDLVYVPKSPVPCSHCEHLIEERVFRREDLQGKTNYRRKAADWQAAVPLHPNCTHLVLPASAWVEEQASKESDGKIPPEGVKIQYKPPSQR